MPPGPPHTPHRRPFPNLLSPVLLPLLLPFPDFAPGPSSVATGRTSHLTRLTTGAELLAGVEGRAHRRQKEEEVEEVGERQGIAGEESEEGAASEVEGACGRGKEEAACLEPRLLGEGVQAGQQGRG